MLACDECYIILIMDIDQSVFINPGSYYIGILNEGLKMKNMSHQFPR